MTVELVVIDLRRGWGFSPIDILFAVRSKLVNRMDFLGSIVGLSVDDNVIKQSATGIPPTYFGT